MSISRLSGLLLAACGLVGCASSGTVTGLPYKTVWQSAGDVLRRRGRLLEQDRKQGMLLLRQSPYFPAQELVERQVAPNAPTPFHGRQLLVEVRLFPSDKEVGLVVYAWSEYHAFSRRFDTDHEPELQRQVFDELSAELAHQRQRGGVAGELARLAAGARPVEGMRYVPAGPFTRGSMDGHPDEQPQRKVLLSAYYIDTDEVTVGQYRKFIAAGGYRTRALWSEAGWRWRETYEKSQPRSWSDKLRDSLPVFGVSWYEAEAFARWAGKRLPTEAQWEKAARWTLPSRYPWGNLLVGEVNCLGQSIYGPVPVDEYPRNVSLVGCRQMGGNVAEWCRDWYDERAYDQGSADPAGPGEGQFKVLRGGSFFDSADAARAAYRDRSRPDSRAVSFGFRCVREPGKP